MRWAFHILSGVASALIGYRIKASIDRRIIEQQNEVIEMYDEMETEKDPLSFGPGAGYVCPSCHSLALIHGDHKTVGEDCFHMSFYDALLCPYCGHQEEIDDHTRIAMRQ